MHASLGGPASPLRDADNLLCRSVATAYVYLHVPTGFIPQEDQNYLICVVQTPPGASLNYTSELSHRAEELVLKDPDVFGTFSVPGFQSFRWQRSNYGLIFVPLKPIDERRGKGHGAADIVARLAPRLFQIPGGIVAMFEPPAVQGIGSFGGFQFQLQDLGRNTLQDLDMVAHKIVGASRQRSDLTGLFTSYTANDPQILLQIDRVKAKAMAFPSARSEMHWAYIWARSTSMTSTSIIARTAYTSRPMSPSA